ncbi:helix-turn-helix transcriptional regulator [Sedimentibacter sp.]|uniref:helix-turn-helix domain-containing protein n=1 Tax=Sedimentibacter sp. TaxID=1960295 RepID=UPI00289D6269|nr:helix-turn-helix transcriptional regulator [Sedimentibacter sp.]
MHNLRLLREERNMSQQRLADEFDIAQSQIQNYETGGYQPNIDILHKYADYFDVSVDFLLGRTNIRHKPKEVKECELSTEEQVFVNRYRSLRSNQRHILDLFLDALEDK